MKGSGLQVHHLIEKRFAGILQLTAEQVKNILSVVVTKTEHQLFTNLWRQNIGYINSSNPVNTLTASSEVVLNAIYRIYKDFPELLRAAKQFLQ